MTSSANKKLSPQTTRRTFLSSAAASIAATSRRGAGAQPGSPVKQADPVVPLWRDWLLAHRLRVEACRRQQKLETELFRLYGSFPRTKIAGLGADGFWWVYSDEEIDRLLPEPGQEGERSQAKAELSARLIEWKTADQRIGYAKAKKSEEYLAGVEEDFANQLWATSPRSTSGVAAKLHSLLEIEDPGSGLTEPPWPQLRQILRELVKICASSDPA